MNDPDTLSSCQRPSILFFGRKGCEHTRRGVELLELLNFNYQLEISKKRGELLSENIHWWRGDYIVCFRSHFILPDSLLRRAKVAAINFHPGPPEYPGSGCINWALYEDAKEYGATAHLMVQEVDSGPIIECRRFPVLPKDNVSSLLARTHAKTFDLMIDTLTGIFFGGLDFLNEKMDAAKNEIWSKRKKTIKALDDLQHVSTDSTEEELKRIVRATHSPGFPPYIELHGYRFDLRGN